MGGHQTVRLVIAPQLGRGRRVDPLAIDLDHFRPGDLEGRRVECLAVDLDAAILDHPLDLTAGGHAGAGEEFGDAF